MEILKSRNSNLLYEKLQEQRVAGRFCDVIFHVGKESFTAHKNVLAATSPYFDSVLKTQHPSREHITVPPQDQPWFEKLLDFIYTGNVTLDAVTVIQLLKLSSHYFVDDLKILCEKYLEENLNYTNCLHIYDQASKFGLNELKNQAAKTVKEELPLVLAGPEVMNFSDSQLEHFLWHKAWNFAENAKFKIITDWANRDVEERSLQVIPLMRNIGFRHLHSVALEDVLTCCKNQLDPSLKLQLFSILYDQDILPEEYVVMFECLKKEQNPAEEVDTVEPEIDQEENNELQLEQRSSDHEEEGSFSAEVCLLSRHHDDIESEQAIAVDAGLDDNNDDDDHNDASDPPYLPPGEVDSDSDGGMPLTVDEEVKPRVHELHDSGSQRKAIGTVKLKPPAKGKGRPRKKPMTSRLRTKRMTSVALKRTLEIKPEEEEVQVKRKRGRPAKQDKSGKSGKVSGEFACDICDFKTSTSRQLHLHHTQAHKEGTVLKCHRCDFETYNNRGFYKHLRLHYDGPPFHCEFENCEYSADRVQYLLTHRMKHTDERPFKCSICHFKFRNKWTLTAHLKIHTGEKPFSCPICNQAFTTKGTMSQHMVIHSDARPYLCDVCGFSTKYQSHLTTHRRIHTGNVFRCSVCDYFTPKKNQLTNHMKIHLDIRSYVCSTCGRAFTEKSHLVRHERIHNPEKPFKCEKCSYATYRRDKLKAHVLKHHDPKSGESSTPYKPRKPREPRKVLSRTSAPEVPNPQLPNPQPLNPQHLEDAGHTYSSKLDGPSGFMVGYTSENMPPHLHQQQQAGLAVQVAAAQPAEQETPRLAPNTEQPRELQTREQNQSIHSTVDSRVLGLTQGGPPPLPHGVIPLPLNVPLMDLLHTGQPSSHVASLPSHQAQQQAATQGVPAYVMVENYPRAQPE